jgi:membrane-associated protease RseP (regulator of RpoE activity)
MTEQPAEKTETAPPHIDLERITSKVSAEFQVEESQVQQGAPTYYLKWPQETKKPFLRLLNSLAEMNLIAFLRRENGRVVLRIAVKPPVKPSKSWTFWVLLFATIATTFATGYFILPPEAGINPFISGAIFSASIITVLGVHEMGHKLTANRKKIEATSPYFIPGPPPLGTFGAVIMQKSLPANRDTLFDVGANGPIAGFIVALVFSAVGLTLLIPTTLPPDSGTLNLIPVSWVLLERAISGLNLIPQLVAPQNGWFLHPVAYAGWAGMVVTMLNLLPAAMLDGGHVARSIVVSDKLRLVLTFASVLVLLFASTGFVAMAFLIVFMSVFRHPGPLDDVSGLSKGRKLAVVGLAAVFVLAFPLSM